MSNLYINLLTKCILLTKSKYNLVQPVNRVYPGNKFQIIIRFDLLTKLIYDKVHV